MRVVIISDTHMKHEQLGRMSGEVLIHCGDFCNGFRRDPEDLGIIDEWFAQQDFALTLCVGGNHDLVAQKKVESGEPVLQNAVYLQDSGYTYRGVNFYGAPWVPNLPGWAYHLDDDARAAKWELVPDHTHILITHTPPRGVLDLPYGGKPSGCPHLRKRVNQIAPPIHCFGHIHNEYGVLGDGRTKFINAALMERGQLRMPIVVDL